MAIKEIRNREFFEQDTKTLARQLLGKILCHKKYYKEDDTYFVNRGRIIATEVYFAGESVTDNNREKESNAQMLSAGHLHFHKGRGRRIDIVANKENVADSILIREIDLYNGPTRTVDALELDSSAEGVDLLSSDEIWLEDDGVIVEENEPRARVGLSEKTATKEEINAKQHYSVKELHFE